MKHKFTINIESESAQLLTADTIDHEISRLASALSLFAQRFTIELDGAATGSWSFEQPAPRLDLEDEEW